VTSVQIFYGIKEITGNPFPFALVVVMLTATLLLYLTSKFLFGRDQHAVSAKATTASGARTVGKLPALACTLIFFGITLLALLPHLGVVGVSLAGEWYRTVLPGALTLDHYETALGHYLTVPSILNSLKYASIATVVDLVLGVTIAYIVVRTDLPGRGFLDALAMLPLAVPGLVLAFGYISMTQEGKFFARSTRRKIPPSARHRLLGAPASLYCSERRRWFAADQRHAGRGRGEPRLPARQNAVTNHLPADPRQCDCRSPARVLVRHA
jgi:iron(III) transport system permease protein